MTARGIKAEVDMRSQQLDRTADQWKMKNPFVLFEEQKWHRTGAEAAASSQGDAQIPGDLMLLDGWM